MQQLFIKAKRWQIVTDKYDVSQLFDKRKSSLKGNDTVQIHFKYSYKLRIFFHTVRFAHRTMKHAKKLGASIKLRKTEICDVGWGIVEF